MSKIVCKDLTKIYSNHKVALDHINFTCENGRIVGLLGPNGSGKTTLMKLMQTLLMPTSGSIEIDGLEPGVETKAFVSYLPDVECYDPKMKVRDLVNFYDDFYMDFDLDRALEMMSELHIDQDMRMQALSKGNKEKVALILCMARNAKLYILDEPIGGVDPATRDYILHTILSNFDTEKSSLLISTHLITDVESILDDVIMINEGKIVTAESVDAIREGHGQSVNEYFKEVFKCY